MIPISLFVPLTQTETTNVRQLDAQERDWRAMLEAASDMPPKHRRAVLPLKMLADAPWLLLAPKVRRKRRKPVAGRFC